jgi:hypothetical protein
MQSSLREALIDSHVAAIAIAVLLFSSVSAAFMALWGPADFALSILASEAAIKPSLADMNLEYVASRIVSEAPYNLPVWLSLLASALACLFAAWLLSRWTYGVGPLRALGSYRDKLSRKTHA